MVEVIGGGYRKKVLEKMSKSYKLFGFEIIHTVSFIKFIVSVA